MATFAPCSCPETVPLKVEDRGDAPREVAVGGLVGGPQAVAAPVEQGPQQGREGVPEGQALRVDGQERLALDAGLGGHETRGDSQFSSDGRRFSLDASTSRSSLGATCHARLLLRRRRDTLNDRFAAPAAGDAVGERVSRVLGEPRRVAVGAHVQEAALDVDDDDGEVDAAGDRALARGRGGRVRGDGREDGDLGRKRVIQCRFNVAVPRARVPEI